MRGTRRRASVGELALVTVAWGVSFTAHSADTGRWVERFAFVEPQVESRGVCEGVVGALPAFTVTPDTSGEQLVRVSLPFAPAAFPIDMGLKVLAGDTELAPDVRVLTRHLGSPASVRRAIITFPFRFETAASQVFQLFLSDTPLAKGPGLAAKGEAWSVDLAGTSITLAADHVTIRRADGGQWTATLVAPARSSAETPVAEVVEWGRHYGWVRLLIPDRTWPRIIEVRADSLGTVAVQAHVQRLEKGDATAPDLGWAIEGPPLAQDLSHSFSDGASCVVTSADASACVYFPAAPFDRRGGVSALTASGKSTTRFLRCSAEERVPFQEAAWRRAAFVVDTPGRPPLDALLEPPIKVEIPVEAFDALYDCGKPLDLALWPALDDLRAYTHQAIAQSIASGDDFGNVTSFQHSGPAGVYGMNRLNHCSAIFEEAWRLGDALLRDVAVQWCGNMYDLSLWWGDTETCGGTRYNNAVAAGKREQDPAYMWRTNDASNFCTKGCDSFFYAYEETGDPRMLAALRGQLGYTAEYVHVDQGECRNIGDVADFMALCRCTGLVSYRDEALRLFRELRTKLSAGNLFSQGGQPIVDDPPFMDDDALGYKHPFAKPYIIGYALAGLPDLLREMPDEPKLRDVVRAVADFQAGAQDPVGGWRYPHPRSSRVLIDQAMEHAAQLARAAEALEARGESIDGPLDAIERTLQARVNGYQRTGTILSGLQGWESNLGALPEGKTIYDLYKKPADRDPSRDYTDGQVSVGGASPEGLVYFSEVLAFYVAHRPAERLFHSNDALSKVLARVPDARIRLVPQEKGSFLRMERPEDPEIGFTLWAPEWATFPPLTDAPEEMGGMTIDWQRDDAAGAVWYTLDRKEATFTACFIPHTDYVECTYTVWPKPGVDVPGTLGIGPCQQMKAGVFEGEEAELLGRLWFLSDGAWTTIGSCAGGNPRNVLFLKGQPSPDMDGDMKDSGWRTIQSPRPDNALIACVSRDGAWVAATAAESATSLCNNSAASHRCIHSQGSLPLRKDGPTTLRVSAYLFKGTVDDLRQRYACDVTRWKLVPAAPAYGEGRTDTYGMRAQLPSFHERRIARLDFPLAWPASGLPFDKWRARARDAYLASLSVSPPPAPFEPRVLAVERRDGYEARKLAFNISADNRILAYLLVPDGAGPFPAIIALHDHGAHFSIGKEKVVRPFGVSKERSKDAEAWVKECYGGRFMGDELARRGYVVFAMDALFWGDRGRAEGVLYEDQQALAANMLQLGQSWAGIIVWDDVRSAQFVQGLPEVDPERLGCIGLSMGSNRAWHLAAATDIIRAGAAICWLGDTATLMGEGNNQTKGYSAFSMLHPGLRNLLDYPDVASIACPKPMLFYNGEKDGLFPIPGVQAAYEKLHRVWRDQGVEERLETRLWPVPHEFNQDMQQAAFDWLDRWLK